ncbi:MAG: hypothetical protein PHR45_00590 [Muribaculaceae bacterium]|nr:hypothetical protein [Muribaculaceae bacterium]
MKKFIILAISFVLIAIGFSSCKTGVFATEGGKDDMAFIQLLSSGEMANKTVTIILDNDTKFDAKVLKMKQATEKHNGETYGVKPGKREITVIFNGKVIYKKYIFTSSQQTKTIIL